MSQAMIVLEEAKAPEGSTCCSRGPQKSAPRSQPAGALLWQIYETKILARLFCTVGAAESLSIGLERTTSASQEVRNHGPPSQGLCACERAALAAQLMQRLEKKVLCASDLSGSMDGIPLTELGAALKKPPGVSWNEGAGELLGGRRLPFSTRTLIEVLSERLKLLHRSQEGVNKDEEGRVICPTCRADLTEDLHQLLDSCVSFSALCRLYAFPISPKAFNKLSTLVSAARKRERRTRETSATPSDSLPEDIQTIGGESELNTRRSIANGAKGGSDGSSRLFLESVTPGFRLRDGPPNNRLELKNFVKIQQVGQGAYGDVWLGCEVHTGQWVALKRMKSQQQQQPPHQQLLDPHHHAAAAQQQMLMWHVQNNTEDREGFPKTAIREISLLRELRDSPHVVKLLGVAHSKPASGDRAHKGSVWMLFEFLPFDLLGFLDAIRNSREKREKYHRPTTWLSVGEIKGIMLQLLMALHHCHRNNIVHRDLKTANLLMDAEGTIKLADFGLARRFSRFICSDHRPYQAPPADPPPTSLLHKAPTCGTHSPPRAGGDLCTTPSEPPVKRRRETVRDVGGEKDNCGEKRAVGGGSGCGPVPLRGSQLRPLTNRVITLWYRPPELLLGCEAYDASVDLWSAGCIMAELLCAFPLFAADKEAGVLKQIAEKLGPPSATDLAQLRSLTPPHAWSQVFGFGGGASGCLGAPGGSGDLLLQGTPHRALEFQRIIKHKNQAGEEGWDLLSRLLAWNPTKRISACAALEHPWFRSSPLPVRAQRRQLAGAHSFLTKARKNQPSGPKQKASQPKKPSDGGRHLSADAVRVQAWQTAYDERVRCLKELREWHRETQNAAAAEAAVLAEAGEAIQAPDGNVGSLKPPKDPQPQAPAITRSSSDSRHNSSGSTFNTLEWKQEERRRRFGALAKGTSSSSPAAESVTTDHFKYRVSEGKKKETEAPPAEAERLSQASVEAGVRQQLSPKERAGLPSGRSDTARVEMATTEGPLSWVSSSGGAALPSFADGVVAPACEAASLPSFRRRRPAEEMAGRGKSNGSFPVEPRGAAAAADSCCSQQQQEADTQQVDDRPSRRQAAEKSKAADAGDRARERQPNAERPITPPPQLPREERQQRRRRRSVSSGTDSYRRSRARRRDSPGEGRSSRRRGVSSPKRGSSSPSPSHRVAASSSQRDSQRRRELHTRRSTTHPAAATAPVAFLREAFTSGRKVAGIHRHRRSVSSSSSVSKCSTRNRSVSSNRNGKRSSISSSRLDRKRSSSSSSSSSRPDATRKGGRSRGHSSKRHNIRSSSSSLRRKRRHRSNKNRCDGRSISSRSSRSSRRNKRRSINSSSGRHNRRRSVSSRGSSVSGHEKRRGSSCNRRDRMGRSSNRSISTSPRRRGYREKQRQQWQRSASRSAARSSVSDISDDGPPCQELPSPPTSLGHRMYSQGGRGPGPTPHPPVGWCGRSSSPHYVHSEETLYHRTGQRRYHEGPPPPHYADESPLHHPPPYGMDNCSPFAEGRLGPGLHTTPGLLRPPLPRAEPLRHQRGPRSNRLFS